MSSPESNEAEKSDLSGPQSPTSSQRLGEFDIIARYFSHRSSRGDVLLGVGDDAAIIETQTDRRLVLAMDTIVENVHFLPHADAADIGYRALAVNLSDLAAMGAEPSWMSLSLSLPHADEQWLADFAGGLFALADCYDVQLIGGDTVRGPLVVTVQVGGWVEADRWLTRSGARVGDAICLSGTVGDAAGGLEALRSASRDGASYEFLRERFLRPKPRVALGRILRTRASAAMDVSDGVLTDLQKLCTASGCGARIEIDQLPLSHALQEHFSRDEADRFALTGGDDYELLFTVPADQIAAIQEEAQMPITQIGVITSDRRVVCFRGNQQVEPPTAGYDHFAS